MTNTTKSAAVLHAKEAAKITEAKLKHFTHDDSLMRGLVYGWLEIIAKGDRSLLRTDHTIIARTKFEELLRTKVQWKGLAVMPSIEDLVNPRIALAERCVAIIPNEGRKWMLSTLANNPDLTIFFHELLRYLTYWKTSLKDVVACDETKRDMLRQLKLMPDMQAWTVEQTHNLLLKNQGISKYLAYMLQTMLETTYLNTINLYRLFVDQSGVHPTLGMEDEKGLCMKDGAIDCDCANCSAGTSYKQTSIERIEWHRNIVGDAITQSKVWGEYNDFIMKVHELDVATFVSVGSKFGETSCIAALCVEGYKIQSKAYEIRIKEMQSQVSKTERALTSCTSVNTNLNNKLQALQQGRIVADTIGSNSSKKAETNKRESIRQIKQMRDELDMKANELIQTKELLKAILSPQEGSIEQNSATISLSEVCLKRGVVIGGHYGLTDKLRRKMPNSIFYSPDAKSVDVAIIKNSEYVLFLTEYVNHNVSSHALNLCREHNIRQGYSNKTNVQLVLEDIAHMFANELMD